MDTKILISIIIGSILIIIAIIVIIVMVVLKNKKNKSKKTEDQKKTTEDDQKKTTEDDQKKNVKMPSRKYTFHQGVDSSGNDVKILTPYADKIALLKANCDVVPTCVAFNTNGWLKSVVNPPSTWAKWTSDPNKGLYVVKK